MDESQHTTIDRSSLQALSLSLLETIEHDKDGDFQRSIEHYESTPTDYLNLFGKAWHKQGDIINSVRDHKETYVRSANGVGKTHTAAAIILWWLDVYRHDAKVISTAKTFDQVKFVLWARLRQMYDVVKHRFSSAPMLLTSFQPDMKHNPDWFAVGYNPKVEGTEATAFQGHHSKSGRVLFVLEEAITTAKPIWDAIEGSLGSQNARLLAIFNPTTTGSEVFQREQEGRGNLITISAQDLFNSDEWKEDSDLYDGLVHPEEADRMVTEYGKDSPIVQARIFGDYPKTSIDAAISYEGCAKAKNRYEVPKDEDIERHILSWDVAGEGADFNVLGVLEVTANGVFYRRIDRWQADHTTSMSKVLNHIQSIKDRSDADIELVVDSVGEGSHVPSFMEEYHDNVDVVGFKAGSKSEGIIEFPELVFLNKISEAWYRAHLILDMGQWVTIGADFDATIMHELSTRLKHWNMKNKEPLVWYIEPKDEFKKRNRNKSPDDADAFIMAIWLYCQGGGGFDYMSV